jgi:rhodanese-related sulfurtransferase
VPLLRPALQGPRIPGQESLSCVDARRLLADGGQLLAVHSSEEPGCELMNGAMNLPLEALCYEYRRLNKRQPVILYCTSHAHCGRIANLLAAEGFSDIYHLSLH